MIHVEDAVRAMFGNKGAGNDQVLAAGSREPGNIPAYMIDGAIADRNEKGAVFRRAITRRRHMATEQGPLAVIHATRKAPVA